MTVYDSNANKITGELGNVGVAVSAEYGRKNVLSRGWYIEPQAQLTLGYLGGDSYQTSNDDLLNKAHVKYLENRFYCLAQDSGRAVIINSTVPTCSSISEYDEAMLQEFISNARLLVNTLGYKLFDTLEESSVGQQNEPTCFFINAARGAAAKGLVVADGFAVLKGSTIASPVVPSMAESLRRLRDSLLEKGIVDADFHFVKDHIFTSPSLAAAVVLGRNANGRTEWKTAGNKALRDVEEDELA